MTEKKHVIIHRQLYWLGIIFRVSKSILVNKGPINRAFLYDSTDDYTINNLKLYLYTLLI